MRTRNVGLKLQALNKKLRMLPGERALHWANLVTAKMATQDRGVAVGAPEGAITEWDLQAANWLDRVYTAVSDEATRVRKEGTAALAETTSQIGWGLWPLGLVVVAVLLSYGKSKR